VKIHPHDQVLQEFAATLSGVDSAVLDHLAECQRCRERILFLVDRASGSSKNVGMADVLPWPTTLDGVDYGPAIDAAERSLLVRARILAVERAEAPRRVVELLEHPPERREMLMRNHPRFQTWGLLERLIERVREETFEDPEDAVDLSQMAISLADCLDAAYYGAERIEDLRGRAWGYAGNARRVASDLMGAEEAFEKALRHLRKGTGDPLERALLLDLKASLLREQRRFDAAMHLLKRALRIYRDLGETHLAGRVLVKFSTIHEQAGNPERAIPLLYQALPLIDASREPRLLLGVQHNLITNLAEAGRFMEAHGHFIQARPLYARFPDAWMQNRRHWVEGRIARGLGQTREAEAHLLAAQEGFLAENSIFDTALVSLDLAALYTAQRRTTELREIAEEMIAVFSWSQMHRETRREALAALSYLCQAAAAERASLEEVVARVAAFLKRLRHNPALPFRQPDAAVNAANVH
jgi:tetratricopeptide (TPR) repeat protein